MRHFELNKTNLLRKCNNLKYDFLFIALFFRNNYNFLNIFLKKDNKFGIVAKPRPSSILQLKIF